MSSETPSTNLTLAGDWAKPVTVLIEKISDALGGAFKPGQLVRVAKAEAEAAKIASLTGIEITEMEERALRRLVAEETKRQANIESITLKALPGASKDAKPENIEDDWLATFFDKCRLVSDTEMQSLWSKVLTGEANSPGSYSKRTINFLASIDKYDAALFTSFCGYCWLFGGDVVPLIMDEQDPIYTRNSITFISLQHLETIGFVNFESMGLRRTSLPRYVAMFYYNDPMIVEFSQDDPQWNSLDVGKCTLTSIGKELAFISGSSCVAGFMEYILEKWMALGLTVFSPYPQMTVSYPPGPGDDRSYQPT